VLKAHDLSWDSPTEELQKYDVPFKTAVASAGEELKVVVAVAAVVVVVVVIVVVVVVVVVVVTRH